MSTTTIARTALPLLSDIDDCQIIARGEVFVLNFSASPLKGLPPHGVDFVNLSQVSRGGLWTWEFGDGDTSNEINPSHIYLDEGEYTVTLRFGSVIYGAKLTKYDYISVKVNLIIDPLTGEAPLKVSFGFDETYLG